MFVQLVLKPTGLLPDHVRCFETMQAIFALFKRGLANEITMARDVNRIHHELYMRLYPECGKPKLHYCMHVIDCWERFGILLSCFGAESNHRYSADEFSFSYRKPCTTALLFDVRRLSQAIADGKTFQHTYLAGNVTQWDDDTLVELGDWGVARIAASSTELVGTLGRYLKSDLVEWQIAAKLHCNWYPVVILATFCTIFRAGPVWKGLGAQFGRKAAEIRPKLKLIF